MIERGHARLVRDLAWVVFCFVALGFSFPSVVQAQNCVPPPFGIVAWWPFDEGQGTTAIDVVGGNDGIHVGTPQHAAGIVSGALRFNGIGSYVAVPDSDLWAFGTRDFTLEFWANFDLPAHGTTGHPGNVFLSNDNGPFNVDKWIFALSSTALEFVVGETATGSGVFSPVVPFAPQVGRWYHLALTRAGTDYRIYVDGLQVLPTGANLAVIPNPASPLTIGAALEPLGGGGGAGGFMTGFLDEVTIYHRALSQAELRAIAAAGSLGKCRSLVISTVRLAAVQLGDQVSQLLEARSGRAPIEWTVKRGVLPSGISLSGNGLLTGTANEAGSFPLTVEAIDADGQSASKDFVFDVLLISPRPELQLDAVGTLPVPGRAVDYFVLVENTGNVAATDFDIHALLDPSQFTLISTDPIASLDAPSLAETTTLMWNISSLGPGESTLLTYRARLKPAVPLGSEVHGARVFAITRQQRPGLVDCIEQVLRTTSLCSACFLACDLAIKSCTLCPATPCPPCILPCTLCVAEVQECWNCFRGAAPVADVSPGLCWESIRFMRDVCYSQHSSDDTSVEGPAVGPLDPNEKLVVAPRFVPPDQTLVYPIHFENIGTVEARDVFVSDILDSALDEGTLKILTPQGGSYDPTTRTLTWNLLGLNLSPGGTGNLLFSVKPRSGLPSGTIIRNKATVKFEVFESIATNEVETVIDATRPTCSVTRLSDTTPTEEFSVSWAGSDTVGQVEKYSVLVSVDGAGFMPFVEKTKQTSALFHGAFGHSYGFLCIATDTAGNVETKSAVAATVTRVIAVDSIPPTTTATPTPGPNVNGWNNTNMSVTLTATDNPGGSGVKQISYSQSGAQTGSAVAPGSNASTTVSAEGMTTITYFATDNAGNQEAPKTLSIQIDKTPPPITCSVTPNTLWPPNNQLVTVTAAVRISDSLSGPSGFTLTSVTSNEPLSAGDIQGFAVGTSTTVGQLMATRLGTGGSRTYTLTFQGRDVAGNAATCSATVTVPHDQSK